MPAENIDKLKIRLMGAVLAWALMSSSLIMLHAVAPIHG